MVVFLFAAGGLLAYSTVPNAYRIRNIGRRIRNLYTHNHQEKPDLRKHRIALIIGIRVLFVEKFGCWTNV